MKIKRNDLVKSDGTPLRNDKTLMNENERTLYESLLENITVEPMMIPYLIATILVILTNQNLNLQKACRVNLNLDSGVCTALENKQKSSAVLTDSEITVQKLVADMLIWQTALQNGIPAVFVLYLGSWSDRNRLRRPCMLLPIYGEIIRNFGLLFCVYFFDELPMEVTGLFQTLPTAIAGHWVVMFMAIFSYIGDVSTEKNKTLRVGLVNAAVATCLPLGTGMSGVLYRVLGFSGVYATALVLCFFSILMAHLFIHDTKLIKLETEKKLKTSNWTQIKHFFHSKHIIDAFKVTYKKGANNRRMKIIVLTVLITGVMGPLQGEKNVAYLFTRVKFNWTEVQYSVYSTTMLCVNLIGTFFVLGVVIRKFGIDDALIGTIASVGKVLSQFVFAFASNETVFYFGLLLNCLQGPCIISMKSIMNKVIPAEELGQVTAVTGIGENVVPIICGPIYSLVYSNTVDYLPGAYFLLTAAITIPTIFLYLWLHLQHKKERRGSYVDITESGREHGGDQNALKGDRKVITYGSMSS